MYEARLLKKFKGKKGQRWRVRRQLRCKADGMKSSSSDDEEIIPDKSEVLKNSYECQVFMKM